MRRVTPRGSIPAKVTYAGLAPGFAGLYQVNAEVPQEHQRATKACRLLPVAWRATR